MRTAGAMRQSWWEMPRSGCSPSVNASASSSFSRISDRSRNSANHTAARTMPTTPMDTNIQRQPNPSIRPVSNGGAMAVPSAGDAFQIPIGGRLVARMVPLAHHAGEGGKRGCLADAQGSAGNDELAQAGDEACRHLCYRPNDQRDAQHAARAEAVHQAAGGKQEECIGPEEGRKQHAHLGDRYAEVVADQRVGDRQRAAVHVIEHTDDEDECQAVALRAFQPRNL